MSGITLKKTVAASIPTPATDKITIFHDDSTDAPAYKDDLGVTNPIGGGAPSGSAGGVLGGTYPNPSFAADMATQAELDAHTADTTDAHDASAVSIVDAGGFFTGTEVEAALQELGAGSSGAPTGANYLVGSSQAGLSAEIIVGTTPGGELGGTWASPTVDTTHSGSSHAGTQTAAEATAASALSTHAADTTVVHGFLNTADISPVVYVRPGGATTDIQDAINALPTGGGLIQLGVGIYTPASISFLNLTGVTIRGVGSRTAGADSPTTILFGAAGSSTRIDWSGSIACEISNLKIQASSASYTGNLNAATTQPAFSALRNVVLEGVRAAGQTSVLFNANKFVELVIDECNFLKGGVGLKGMDGALDNVNYFSNVVNVKNTQFYQQAIAPVKNAGEAWKFDSVTFEGNLWTVPGITGVSVANPSVLTASAAHGLTTGQSVTLAGFVTTPDINGARVVTVVTPTTFSIPVNVTSVTDTIGTATPDTALYHSVAYTHDSGVLANALTFINCGFYDVTTRDADGTWIIFAGSALNVIGNRIGGRQVSHITVVALDESQWSSINIYGNWLTAIYKVLDTGTTVATNAQTGGGQIGPNVMSGGVTGYSLIAGTTFPKGIGMSSAISTTAAKTEFYQLSEAGAGPALGFEGDTVARIVRNGANNLYTPAEWQAARDIRAGFGQTATTRIYGIAAGTVAGIAAEGSNSNVDISLVPKGTGRIVLTVRGAAGVPSGAPTGTELPIAYDTTAVTGGTYAWTGAAWVKISTI